jgi:hypothetical protein
LRTVSIRESPFRDLRARGLQSEYQLGQPLRLSVFDLQDCACRDRFLPFPALCREVEHTRSDLSKSVIDSCARAAPSCSKFRNREELLAHWRTAPVEHFQDGGFGVSEQGGNFRKRQNSVDRLSIQSFSSEVIPASHACEVGWKDRSASESLPDTVDHTNRVADQNQRKSAPGAAFRGNRSLLQGPGLPLCWTGITTRSIKSNAVGP